MSVIVRSGWAAWVGARGEMKRNGSGYLKFIIRPFCLASPLKSDKTLGEHPT